MTAERTTTIINLYAGPGAGKSTTAAEVFATCKKRGISCELITEYVKTWAWRGDRIDQNWDGLYITAKQLRRESSCYGKVGIKRVNCLLMRDKPYVQAGRYEDELQARQVDRCAEEFLRHHTTDPRWQVRTADDVILVAGIR